MQTEHYMANMGKPGHAERLSLLGFERVDDRAGRKRRRAVAAPGFAPGRSEGAHADAGRAASGVYHPGSPDGEAQPA